MSDRPSGGSPDNPRPRPSLKDKLKVIFATLGLGAVTVAAADIAVKNAQNPQNTEPAPVTAPDTRSREYQVFDPRTATEEEKKFYEDHRRYVEGKTDVVPQAPPSLNPNPQKPE